MTKSFSTCETYMKALSLGDIDVLPGVVIASNDPDKLGRVKVGGPGLFDRTVMQIDSIPWAYPLTMPFFQSYTRMQDGSKVWVFKNRNAEDEYWYMPYHELFPDTVAAQGDDIESDVIISRNIMGKLVQIYQNKGEGIVIKVGNSDITINREEEITIRQNDAAYKVLGNHCFAGKLDGPFEPMVRGDVLVELLKVLASDFKSLGRVSEGGQTAVLSKPFLNASNHITKHLNNLLSKYASVSS